MSFLIEENTQNFGTKICTRCYDKEREDMSSSNEEKKVSNEGFCNAYAWILEKSKEKEKSRKSQRNDDFYA